MLPPQTSRDGTRPPFPPIAAKPATADSPRESSGVPSRGAARFPPRQSRRQSQRDSFSSSASAFYRPVLEMQTTQPTIRVSVRDQRLDLVSGERVLVSYPISTSRYGLGSEAGSLKTPLGKFKIAEKIGADVPRGTVFRSRI